MRNKIIVALCTVALLLGVMPLCISAADLTDYTEFYIPSPIIEQPTLIGTGTTEVNQDANNPVMFLVHEQNIVWGVYNHIELYILPYLLIHNESLSYGDLSLDNCYGFIGNAIVTVTNTDGNEITKTTDVTFVKSLYFNIYTQKYEVNYIIFIDTMIDSNTRFPVLISNNNFRNSLPMQYLMLTQDYQLRGTSYFIRTDMWESIQTEGGGEILLEFFNYLFRERPIIYDKYIVRDYTNAMNDILESAQTGIATWTTNPLILSILCLVMGICIITVLWKFISIKMRGGF